MENRRNSSAISLAIAFALLFCNVTMVFASIVGTVTHTSGPMAAHKQGGKVKSLAVNSSVEDGDLLVTEKRTYARIKFTDGSEVTLKPASQFRVEKYQYDQSKPKEDAAVFNLVKGGLRTITGQVGKRGDQDSYRMKTPTATIGVRGTVYDVHFCQGSACGAVQPGLYLAVAGGSVVITNDAGKQTTLQVQAGQFVYVKDANTPPVVLPRDPRIPFTPPASVNSGRGGGKKGEGCEVR
jgi:hypothetical protein